MPRNLVNDFKDLQATVGVLQANVRMFAFYPQIIGNANFIV